jgi:NAD(P)-dependent dehydrogenase (short-subunit alcohol dehydrogenase family)
MIEAEQGKLLVDRFDLEGRIALITGGGTGLGKTISKSLAKAGADVVLAARRSEPLAETAAEVKQLGRKALSVVADVTDSRQVNKLIEKALNEFGRIDILVNNAGIAKGVDPIPDEALRFDPKPIWELTDNEWRYSLDTNLTSAFYCSRAVARHMVQQKRGKVINMASLGGLRAVKGNFAYCAAKAGVIMLTKTMAVTWATQNIQVNCIAPGFFEVIKMPPGAEKSKRFFPMGRFGLPQEIGPLSIYLASDASNYVTGECFIIDGAVSAGCSPAGYTPVSDSEIEDLP